jgi:hypothetical protein
MVTGHLRLPSLKANRRLRANSCFGPLDIARTCEKLTNLVIFCELCDLQTCEKNMNFPGTFKTPALALLIPD